MDFDGRELTRFYLEKQDLNKLLAEVQQIQSVDELESHILKHGESIVDLMGGEIDRIEMKLRVSYTHLAPSTRLSMLVFRCRYYRKSFRRSGTVIWRFCRAATTCVWSTYTLKSPKPNTNPQHAEHACFPPKSLRRLKSYTTSCIYKLRLCEQLLVVGSVFFWSMDALQIWPIVWKSTHFMCLCLIS